VRLDTIIDHASGRILTARDGAILIPLRSRAGFLRGYTTVDADDAEWLSEWVWRNGSGYAVRGLRQGGRTGRLHAVRVHREVMHLDDDDPREVDHIDHDTLNNRKSNLRAVTHKINNWNRRSHHNSASQYRNVYWHKDSGRWQAQISADGRRFSGGYFETEEEAATAALELRKLHQQYEDARTYDSPGNALDGF
jgi:hypothetical protein